MPKSTSVVSVDSDHRLALESREETFSHEEASLTKLSAGQLRFLKAADFLLPLYCLSAALSVALSQIFLYPFIALWIFSRSFSEMKTSSVKRIFTNTNTHFYLPIFSWACVCFFSSFWGIDQKHSLAEAAKSALLLLIPAAVAASLAWHSNPVSLLRRSLSALIASQVVAALHTVLSLGLKIPLQEKIPGAVTESGQLVLILPLIFGFLLFPHQKRDAVTLSEKISLGLHLVGTLALLLTWGRGQGGLFALLTWGPGGLLAVVIFALLTLHILSSLHSYYKQEKGKTIFQRSRPVLIAALSFLILAFIFNLKRGPWFGVFLEVLCFGFLFSKRLTIIAVSLAIGVLLLLSPVRDRIGGSMEDFSIHGGRQSMWSLGSDLIQTFPFGIGFGNSRVMRVLDPTLPPLHRHMHNNLLQVTVETGWIGSMIFIWWMLSALRFGFSLWCRSHHQENPNTRALSMLAVSMTIALLGWQCAGVVEYNYGDSEIRLIAFLYMGMLIGCSSLLSKGNDGDPPSIGHGQTHQP